MRVFGLFGLLMFAGCSAWVFPEPAERWPRPAVFGTPVWDGAVLRPTSTAVTVSGTKVFVAVRQGAGRASDLTAVQTDELTVVEFTPANGTVRTLPAPPLDAGVAITLWPSATGGVLALQGQQLAAFDGTRWATLPNLPTARPDLLRRVDEEHLVLRAGMNLWVLGGGTWRPLDLSPTPGTTSRAFGPSGPGETRVLWTHGSDGLCTARVTLADLSLVGSAKCQQGATDVLGGDALNGTLDDFHAWYRNLRDLTLLHFTSTTGWGTPLITRGQELRATPASAEAMVSEPLSGTLPIHTLVRVSGGKPTEALYVHSWELLGCDGLQPRTCAQRLGALTQLYAEDGNSTYFLLENVVDARRSLYLKTVALPHRDGGACAPSCLANQLCVRGSGIANLCVQDPSR